MADWPKDRTNAWIGTLFAIGSACFLVGPLPGYVQLVGSSADGMTFFVGSIFFTSAAFLQLVTTGKMGGGRGDWWASGIQFAGTLFFNLSTHAALQSAFDTAATDRLVWRPDFYGSVCFLVSSYIAFHIAARGRFVWDVENDQWRIAAANLAGAIAFGISAVTSFVVPKTGNVVDLAASNLTTSIGGAFFLLGAIMLFPRFSDRRAS